MPLAVSTDVVPVGDASSAGQLTVLVYPGATPSSFVLHDEDGATTEIDASPGMVTMTRAALPTLLRVRADAVSSVTVDGAAAPSVSSFDALASSASPAWFAEPATRSVWVKVPSSATPHAVGFD